MDHSPNPAPEDAESSRGSRPTSAPLPPHSLFAHRRRAGHSRRSEIVRDSLAGNLVKMLVSSINKRRMTSVPGTKRCHPPTREGVWSTRVGARIELCLSNPLLGCWGCAPIVVHTRGETLSSHEESRHLTRNPRDSLAGGALSVAAYVPPCQGRPRRSSGCPDARRGAEVSDLRLTVRAEKW